MPLAEDDAEVLGVPGEEHLDEDEQRQLSEAIGQLRNRKGGIRTFMLHMGPGAAPPWPPPWSMSPWPMALWSWWEWSMVALLLLRIEWERVEGCTIAECGRAGRSAAFLLFPSRTSIL